MKEKPESMKYAVSSVLYEKCYSRKNGLPMIKILLHEGSDEFVELLHTHYLCFDHLGFARESALNFLLRFLKKSEDFYELGKAQGGISTDNVFTILENAPDYFRSIKAIEIGTEGKYKQLLGVQFGD